MTKNGSGNGWVLCSHKDCGFPLRILKFPNKKGRKGITFCPKCGSEFHDGKWKKIDRRNKEKPEDLWMWEVS